MCEMTERECRSLLSDIWNDIQKKTNCCNDDVICALIFQAKWISEKICDATELDEEWYTCYDKL